MIFLISFLLSLFLTFIFWKLGEKYKIYDEASKDPLKIHKKSIPCLGGLAMVLTLIIILFIQYNRELLFIIASGLLVFFLGFKDDLKWRDKFRIKRIYKFLFLVLVSFLSAFILSSAGLSIKFMPGLELILTFLCIFILINVVNYQDGMDGMAGGTTIISLIGFFFLSITLNSGLGLALSLVSITAVLGFFVFNFPPARIFMGDSGAYFLGFILSVLVMILLKPYDLLGALAMAFILGLPLFDGVYTNIRRLLNRKPIFLGDREHFYDKMLKKGFSARKTIFLSYLLQTMSVLIGLLIYA